MENLIDKLDKIDTNGFKNWSLNEIKQLLDIYFIISKKENHIFNLIYSYHGCDSWEDIFRDYNIKYFEIKAEGVEISINEVMEKIAREKIAREKQK
jgi:hypothetical protein